MKWGGEKRDRHKWGMEGISERWDEFSCHSFERDVLHNLLQNTWRSVGTELHLLLVGAKMGRGRRERKKKKERKEKRREGKKKKECPQAKQKKKNSDLFLKLGKVACVTKYRTK